MAKSIFDEINQTDDSLFTQDFNKKCACVMRRNYYALETSSIKESFDSDVFNMYEDSKYDSVERPTAKSKRLRNYSFNQTRSESLSSTKDISSEQDSLDSVISNFNSFTENPIIANDNQTTSHISAANSALEKLRLLDNNNNNNNNSNNDDNNEKKRLASTKIFQCQESLNELKEVQNKVKEIDDLDYSVNSLIFKAVEVHTDILVMDSNVTRLIAETKELINELEDVKVLDELIDILNQDIGPVIHKEWKYTKCKCEGPVEEGIMVM